MMHGVISDGASLTDRILIGLVPALCAVSFYRLGEAYGFASYWAVLVAALAGCVAGFLADLLGRWRRSQPPDPA